MRLALDTNILLYAQGLVLDERDRPKVAAAIGLMERLRPSDHHLYVPAQVVAEFHHVLVRRARSSLQEANEAALDLLAFMTVLPTTETVLRTAFILATEHKLQSFDSVALAAAAEGGCDLLLSEDMQDGFAWRGVRVANPLTGDRLFD